MSRSRPIIVPGSSYHLISRFVNREWFIDGDAKRDGYLCLLGDALKRSDWRCLGYALMSNHIHLAFVAGEQPLAWIRRVHSPFAVWINSQRDRIGSVFARGPKVITIAPDQLAPVLAYIHNNPVRAAVVSRARESRWTSHRAYVGLERVPRWLHVEEGYSRSGLRDHASFDRWVADPNMEPLEQAQVLAPPEVSPIGTIEVLAPDVLVETVANELGISPSSMASARNANASLAREVAARCAAELGITGVSIARAIGVTPQAVSLLRRRNAPGVQHMVERVLRSAA